MRCAACGTENRADRKFCARCGAALAVACPTCVAANVPGERFCGECGSSLAGVARVTPRAIAPAPATAGPGVGATSRNPGHAAAERRLVSVLFADLVGSPAIAEARDPETIRARLVM